VAVPKRPATASNGTSKAVGAARARSAARVEAPVGRVEVRKTYKLYIGGTFPRSESGRSNVVSAADGTPLANAVRASRKDLRDAVRAARGAFQPWADRTAMNRGQVLYRVAELMEGRRQQFEAEVVEAEGVRADRAREIVARAIDRWVWYAGWADKIAQVLGSSNPVAADYFNFTIPEPTGVVGIVASEPSSLLGLVSRLAPPLVAGNSVVVLASESRPLPAVSLTEVLATSDVPGGVINILTGRKRELIPVLAAHEDVDALDVWGVPDDLRTDVELAAADSVKRVARRPKGTTDARFDWLDDRASERPEWIAAYLEMKTVWHPIGV
jgi:acyl-CoA reductase-like NAD-dependent aldehyde dehydrogenase